MLVKQTSGILVHVKFFKIVVVILLIICWFHIWPSFLNV